MSEIKDRVIYTLKHNAHINKIFNVLMSGAFKTLGLLVKTNRDSILFCGQKGRYSDSAKIIYEYMISKPEYSSMRFVWAADKKYHDYIPGKCIKIVPDTFKYFIETLRCKYWVATVNVERSLRYKKKSTIYLNTWHGTPLKTVGNAAKGRKDYDFSHIDYFCSAGEYETNIYIRDFNVRPQSIINTGLPRNDELYHLTNDKLRTLREQLNIPVDKKVILYAPTWRDSCDGGKTYGIKPPVDFLKWEEKLSDKYIVLLRTHPYTTSLLGVQFDDFVRDVTEYREINDLLMVSDILISDYSATIFDFSILCKPIICFGYDYEEYVKERGLYMELSNVVPGGVERTEDSVIERILNINYIEECMATRLFRDRFLQFGGHATQICVERLMSNKVLR